MAGPRSLCASAPSDTDWCNALSRRKVNRAMNQNSTEGSLNRENTSLTALMDHIVETHHAFCRRELPRLDAMLKSAAEQHGKQHPELRHIYALFSKMSRDLYMHLLKEEETLFPYITQVEESVRQNVPVGWPRFGTVENPIRLLVEDHDHTGNELRAIRRLSNDFTPPSGSTGEDAGVDFATLFDALRAFEYDMQEHIHAENDLLFPRAIALEEAACGGRESSAP